MLRALTPLVRPCLRSASSRLAADASPVSHLPRLPATFINAASPKDVVFGSSTTALFANLANALRLGGTIKPGDEIIVCEADHEANVGPWVRLAREIGCELKIWRVTGDLAGGANLELSKLEEVVGPKTKIVAFTACSNILGQYTPIREVVELVKRRSGGQAKTVLDCVAYAPHAKLDVQAWGVDFLGFSYYKCFAPHVSLLYVAPAANDLLASLGHYFHPSAPSYKLAPGGASYELIYSTAAVLPYIASLSGMPDSAPLQERISAGWTAVQAHEQLLGEKLLNYLTSDASRAKGVRVIGPHGMGSDQGRSAVTISFVVLAEGSVEPTGVGQIKKRIQSKEVVGRFDKSGKVGPPTDDLTETPAEDSLPSRRRLVSSTATSTRHDCSPRSAWARSTSLAPTASFGSALCTTRRSNRLTSSSRCSTKSSECSCASLDHSSFASNPPPDGLVPAAAVVVERELHVLAVAPAIVKLACLVESFKADPVFEVEL